MHMQYKVDPDDALALPSFARLYMLTAAVGLLVAGDLLFWWLGNDALRNPWGVNLSLIAAVLGGSRIIYGALVALVDGDVGADLALAVAMLAALVLGEYWVAAEVVLIAMIGESLEALTFARTHREIQRILDLRPRVVRVRREGQEIEVPASQVRVGETVCIRPGERVPVDGRVLAGRSSVDQSTLTGESLPADKGEGDDVFAGTMNQFGALEVRAGAVGDATTLGRVIQLVAEAQQHKARLERTADRLARYFLPLVMVLAAITFVGTNLEPLANLVSGNPARLVWMPTLAVLVVTCPCSLVLATPAAMMAALAWLARRGVLIKGGAALERLAGVECMAFDKTGTLTSGKLEIGQVLGFNGVEPGEVLRLAASAEQSSEHVIGRAIVRAAQAASLSLANVTDFFALPGAGVCAVLPGEGHAGRLLVGNRRLLEEQNIDISDDVARSLEAVEQAGQTPLLVSVDGRTLGLVGVSDTIRPEAPQVIAELRRLGIEQIAVLTGDRPAAARRVASAIGADRVLAELRPEDKARWLLAWRRGGERARVAMVGDGVNDAPALASADVGLAISGIGNDLAADAGDMILLGDPLATLPGLVRLSRATLRVIRQNILVFAFFVNFLGIALTAWIMPRWSQAWLERSPVAAALFHQVGSVLVLLNAMRLLWFERWQRSFLGRAEDALAAWFDRLDVRLAPAAALAEHAWARRRRLAVTAIALLVVAYAATGVRSIAPNEVAVLRRCGRFAGVLDPGLHIGLPVPWDLVTRERPRLVRSIQIGWRAASPAGDASTPIEWNSPHQASTGGRGEDEAVVLTGDGSLAEVSASVQYCTSDVRAFVLAGRDPERFVRAVAEASLREVLAGHPLVNRRPDSRRLEILTTARSELEREAGERIARRLERLGLGVELVPGSVCFQDVHPPRAVVAAFRDVSSAFKERERMKNEGQAAYREKLIQAGGLSAWQKLANSSESLSADVWKDIRPQVEGEAAVAIHAAEGFAIDRRQTALGEAAGFLALERAQAAAPELTRWRMLLELLGGSLSGKKKLILDTPAGTRRHLLIGQPPSAVSTLLAEPVAPPLERED